LAGGRLATCNLDLQDLPTGPAKQFQRRLAKVAISGLKLEVKP
jgi:hypothetical protein